MITENNYEVSPHRKNHILIVEDDLCLMTALIRVLSSIEKNVHYTWVTSAEQARPILQTLNVSLVIADFGLEGKATGLDLWDFCLETFPQMPFLMMSGLNVERFVEMVGSGKICPPFLPKPFRVTECRNLIQDLLHT